MTAGAAQKGADMARRDNGEPNSDLPTAVLLWPTPAARDHKGANSSDHLEKGTGRKHLDQLPNYVAHLWYTPNVPNGGRALSDDTSDTGLTADGIKRQVGLENQVRRWATPRSSEGEKGGPNQSFGAGGTPLPAQASQWATPTSLNYDKSHQPGNSRSYNMNMERAASLASSLPDRPISTDGDGSSHIRRTLNPLFVEWLMGWPRGWTSLVLTLPGPTACACSATALSLWKVHMRSALLALGLPGRDIPEQASFFG